MNARKNTLRLLGLALIAVLTTGFGGAATDASAHPCHWRLNGCLVCEANGGTCSVEFCPDGSIDHDCF